MGACICVGLGICVYVCMYVCLCVECVSLCVYVCVYVHVCLGVRGCGKMDVDVRLSLLKNLIQLLHKDMSNAHFSYHLSKFIPGDFCLR